jgi:hypothetical protein
MTEIAMLAIRKAASMHSRVLLASNSISCNSLSCGGIQATKYRAAANIAMQAITSSAVPIIAQRRSPLRLSVSLIVSSAVDRPTL